MKHSLQHTLPLRRRFFVALLLSAALASGALVGARPAEAATPSLSVANSIANALFASINTERHSVGTLSVTRSVRLNASAHRHNLWMAKMNTMSHQLLGEPSLGLRITQALYCPWRMVGENIAWNTDWTLSGAYYLQRMMFHEVAPNNGHRLNIINPGYRNVGIDVYMDATHHKMWITEDFGHLA